MQVAPACCWESNPNGGTLAIMAFLAGTSPLMHDFWRAEDPNQKQNDAVHFMKNMALLGAAMALMGVEEPWPVSVPIAQPKGKRQLAEFARKWAA